MMAPSHVALVGMSFCGSSMLSYVLGSLPGCKTIGESHWLTDAHPSGRRVACAHCGAGCPVLTDAFRDSLLEDPTDWYGKIARRLGAGTLISSDKTPDYLERLAPARDFDALVLFKDPYRHAQSYTRVIRQSANTPDLAWYGRYWSTFYRQQIDDYAVKGRKAFLLLDDFTRSPVAGLRCLAGWIGSAFDEAALQYWTTIHHAVGGNFNPYSLVATAPSRLPIRQPAEGPGEELSNALASTDAPAVFQRLLDHPDRLRVN